MSEFDIEIINTIASLMTKGGEITGEMVRVELADEWGKAISLITDQRVAEYVARFHDLAERRTHSTFLACS